MGHDGQREVPLRLAVAGHDLQGLPNLPDSAAGNILSKLRCGGRFYLDGDSPVLMLLATNCKLSLSATAQQRSRGPARTSCLPPQGCVLNSESGGVEEDERGIHRRKRTNPTAVAR